MIQTTSTYDERIGLLRTSLKGPVTLDDVHMWIAELHRELARIPQNASFRLLLDLHGFEPVNVEAHKAMRLVIPNVLASHGLRPAFIDLFDERPEMKIITTRGIRCIAFANVHHDETKMANYEQRIAKPNQRFFTDAAAAEAWVLGVNETGQGSPGPGR